MKVLLVEDQAIVAMELENVLRDLGHEVTAVGSDIDSALAAIAAGKGKFDVALLDVDLRGAPSVPVARALEAARVPFLLCTGYSQTDLEGFGLDGPTIEKPYRQGDLKQALSFLAERLVAD